MTLLRRTLVALVLGSGALALVGPAAATQFPAPTGPGGYILLQGGGCDPNQADVTNDCVAPGATLPLQDYSLFSSQIILAGGEVTPNGFTGSLSRTGTAGAAVLILMSWDVFTVHGPTPGASVGVDVSFAFDGTFSVPNASAGAVQAKLGPPSPGSWGLVSGWDTYDLLCSGQVGGCSVNIDEVLASTRSVTEGVPFGVEWSIRMAVPGPGTGLGTAVADFSNSGTLSFSLPDGYWIESLLGYSGPGSVPELAAAWQICAALAGLVAARRRG